MRVTTGFVLGVIALLSLPGGPVGAETATVDATHSSVLFMVKHLGVSHSWGRFNEMAGTVAIDGKNSLVDVQIKVDSLDTAHSKRDQHLKSPDFFNAKQFPVIAFKGSQVKQVSKTGYEVTGTLTLHGVNRPLTVRLERTGTGKNMQGKPLSGYETRFNINRGDFGMKFMPEGIGDEIFIIVSLECVAGQ